MSHGVPVLSTTFGKMQGLVRCGAYNGEEDGLDKAEKGPEKRCRRVYWPVGGARTLGHALFWANDASLVDELRLSVLTSIALADSNESDVLGLAVAAGTTRCTPWSVCASSPEGNDASPCTLQLVKNLYATQFSDTGPQPGASRHGGIAAKKAADASRCINGKDASCASLY